MQSALSSFDAFYSTVFLDEHRHPVNAALHVFGAIVSTVAVGAALLAPGAWKFTALLYPVIHAAPGLLGHRLFERNVEVGDIRVTRKDHPAWWFILGNYRMTADLLLGRLAWDRRPSKLPIHPASR